ncbi:hypothetical protein AS156_36405 [Bradyrhizobium macuxiense]|uniref:Uncharacterized protein n=1 Tax=Bradyrhizobium macuxiense TaxID=1755647 RepID=A0A109K072_9BRAD|nr:hypothetical protein [Bradyrhizobium macuxiense]KWV58276.1 hypothetical protein AS156_36405 [Bradyrhizobium macuxiense]
MWKSRLVLGVVALTCVTLAVVSALLSLFDIITQITKPLNEVPPTEFRIWIILSVAIGIISKSLFDFFSSTNSDDFYKLSANSIFFNSLKSAILASIASPIVVLSVIQLLRDVNDVYLTCLVGFQNGFFFQTVLSIPKKGRAAK